MYETCSVHPLLFEVKKQKNGSVDALFNIINWDNVAERLVVAKKIM